MQYNHIAIEGNIGSGKTTLAGMLAADYNVRDKKIRAEGIQMRYFAWTLAGVTLASMAIKMLNK